MSFEKLIAEGRTTRSRVEKAKDVEVKSIKRKDNAYFGEIKSRQNVYHPSFDNKKFSCSCSDFTFRKKICKHILALIMKAKESESSEGDLEYYRTGSENLDYLLGGGLPKGCITTAFSNFNTGKTFLASQLGAKISAKEKLPAYYIDTEDFFRPKSVQARFASFFERFGKSNLNFQFIPGLRELTKLLGIDVSFEYSKKKQVSVRQKVVSDAKTCPLSRLVEGHSLIIIDSFSAPFKVEIPTPPRENYPARASLMQSMLGRLRLIIVERDIPAFLTVHSSRDPSSYGRAKPYGASPLGYNVKYILQIRKGTSEEARIFRRFRAPGLPLEEKRISLKRDYGYA